VAEPGLNRGSIIGPPPPAGPSGRNRLASAMSRMKAHTNASPKGPAEPLIIANNRIAPAIAPTMAPLRRMRLSGRVQRESGLHRGHSLDAAVWRSHGPYRYSVAPDFSASPQCLAVEEADPETYSRMLNTIKRGSTSRQAQTQVINELQMILNSRISYYVTNGTDESIVRYYDTVLQRLEDANLKNSSTCHRMALGQPVGDTTGLFKPDTERSSMMALEALVRSSAHRAVASGFEQDVAEADLTSVAQDVLENDRDGEILAGTAVTAVDYPRSCELNIQVHAGILKLPQNRAAGVDTSRRCSRPNSA
jgi:hypothetical protein